MDQLDERSEEERGHAMRGVDLDRANAVDSQTLATGGLDQEAVPAPALRLRAPPAPGHAADRLRWGLKKDPAKVKASHFPAFTERAPRRPDSTNRGGSLYWCGCFGGGCVHG